MTTGDALTIRVWVTPRAQGAPRLRRGFRRSVFSVPLAERRRRLLAIDWVEDASVSRVWPDRLAGEHPRAQARGVRLLPLRPAADRCRRRPARPSAAGAVRLPRAQRRARRGARGRSAPRARARLPAVPGGIGSLANDVSEVDVADLESFASSPRVERPRRWNCCWATAISPRATRIF